MLPPLLDRPPSPPFFDPSTHPLDLEEEKEVPDELFNDLDDLDTEGFLSLERTPGRGPWGHVGLNQRGN